MDTPVLANHEWLTYVSSVWTLDAVLRTCNEWWSIQHGMAVALCILEKDKTSCSYIYKSESKALPYFKYFSICSQDSVYGGVDLWCLLKDQVLPTMYVCLHIAVFQPFQARPHLPLQRAPWPWFVFEAAITFWTSLVPHILWQFLVLPRHWFLLPLPLYSVLFSTGSIKGI